MSREGKELNVNLVWNNMKSGDEKSLTQLFKLFYSDLYRYGIKIFNLPDLVKDSIQDVFMRIWEKRLTLGNVKNPKAYLITSFRRTMFSNKDSLMSEMSDELLSKEEQKIFSFDNSEFIEVQEVTSNLRKVLVKTINALPERQRELIYLRFYFNLSYAEIAPIMEVNEQTVRNLMQRAMVNLRKKIHRDLMEGIEDLDNLLILFFMFFKKK